MFTTTVLTASAICVMCASGIGVSAALKWLHNYELDFSKKKGNKESKGGAHGDRIEALSKRVRPTDVV